MPSTDKERLLLLYGVSLVVLQLAAPPIGSVSAQSQQTDTTLSQDVSCFVAGTMVLMADGREQPIEAITPGDRVLGRRGRVNRVLGCERTRLGRRRLYGLNGRRPFVTAEHPFLTADGWKALDPEATCREGTDLPVLALQLGDRLCRGGARNIERTRERTGLVFVQATTLLEAVAAVEGELATPVFNLLLDGDHSYVADGWIVHNKDRSGKGNGDPAAGATNGGTHAPTEAPSASVDALLKGMGFSSSRDAGLAPAGPPLSPDQEEKAIEQGWDQKN